MKRSGLVTIAFSWLCLSTSGCATPMVARYIYQDAEFGVVGIPVNNYQKKTDFRAEAEGLMARHFPEGFEIVRAEEVNEGERILDLGRKTQIETDPKVAALNQMISLGSLNRTTSYEQKDKLQLRECRIIYRKKPLHTPGRSGQFAVDELSRSITLHRPQRDPAAPDQDEWRYARQGEYSLEKTPGRPDAKRRRSQKSGGGTHFPQLEPVNP